MARDGGDIELADVSVTSAPRPDTAGVAGDSPADLAELVEGDETALRPTDTTTGDHQAVSRVLKTGVAGTSFNFVNSIIGAGIIGLPFALNEAGFVAGLLLIVCVGVTTYYTVLLITSLGVRLKRRDYEDLAEHVLGKFGFYSVLVAMFVFAIGAMIAYLIIIGDTVGLVLTHAAGLEITPGLRRLIVTGAAVVFILPLSLPRDMARLARSSFISLLAVAWIVVVVVVRACSGLGNARVPTVGTPEAEITVVAKNFFPAIGVIAFAFVCHHNCFIVYNSLEDNTMPRWRKTTKISIATSVGACVILSVAGYLTFRQFTEGNLLNNYSNDDEVMNITRIMYAVTMVLTYPMEMFVARHTLTAVAFPGSGRSTNLRHYSITMGLFLFTLAVALVTDNLGIVLELTGGVMGTYLGFILPVVLHLRCTDYRLAFWTNTGRVWTTFLDVAPAMGVLALGLIAMITGTFITISNAVAEAEA